MFDYAIKNILKRKTRSVLTIIGIMVLINLVIVISGIVSYQKRVMHEHASAGVGKIMVQSMLAGINYPTASINLKESLADEILNRDDIQDPISGKVIYWQIEPPPYPNEPPQLLITGVEIGKEAAFTGSISHQTRAAFGSANFSNSIFELPIIMGHQAKQFLEGKQRKQFNIGGGFKLLDTNFTVIGFLEPSSDKVVNNSLIIPLSIAQKILEKQEFISSVILFPQRIDDKQYIIEDIRQKYPKLNLVTDDTISRNAEEGIKLFEQMVGAISTVVILGAAILILTVMLITIKERTREIGVLRAIGASNKIVISSILWEIFILSAVGSVLGGLISGIVLRYFLLENLFDVWHILKYMPLAVVLTLVSGIIPAIRISRILPVESLRYE